MQGLGNDYLYVFGEVPSDIESLSKKLSDRHFGAGADGMIYISKSNIADFKMRIFNADGSEAKMCGNGIRCVGKFVYDKNYTNKTNLTIETLSGIKKLTLEIKDEKVSMVTVDMGKTIVSNDQTLDIDGKKITLTPVSVGNPHAVTFVENLSEIPLESLGQKIEKHKNFVGGVNAEFVQVIDKNNLRMRVWERGSGVTLACGTGACAVCSVAVSKGICRKNEEINVKLDGGTLNIKILDDNTAEMKGPAEFVFEGESVCKN